MKWLSLAAMLVLSAFLVTGSTGCKKGETKTGEGEGGKKLSVTAPGATDVKQGDSATVTVKISRTKFTDPVTVEFSNLPDKVKVVETDMTILKDKEEGKFTLKALDDAPVESKEATVKVSGAGITQEAKFKVNVTKK